MEDFISRSALLAEVDDYIEENRECGTYANSFCADVAADLFKSVK